MKCYSCNKEWNDIKGIAYPSKCPYCGKDPHEYSAADALRIIREEYGSKVFEDKNRFSGLIMDMLAADPMTAKVLSIVEREDLHRHYANACHLKEHERELELRKARKKLEQFGFRDEIITVIDQAYKIAWKLEWGSNPVYADADNAYYKIGTKLFYEGKVRDAAEVLKVSYEAGNEKSFEVLARIISCNQLPAYVLVEHFNKYGFLRDLREIAKTRIWYGCIRYFIENDMGLGYYNTELLDTYIASSPEPGIAMVGLIEQKSQKCLDSIFFSRDNEKRTLLTKEQYEQISSSIEGGIDKWGNNDKTKEELACKFIKYCAARKQILLAFNLLRNGLSADFERVDEDTQKKLFSKYLNTGALPENHTVFQILKEYCEEKGIYEKGFELEKNAPLYGEKPDLFQMAKYCSNLCRLKESKDYARLAVNTLIKKNTGYHTLNYFIEWASWYIEQFGMSAQDITLFWRLVLSDETIICNMPEETLEKGVQVLYQKVRSQTVLDQIADEAISKLCENENKAKICERLAILYLKSPNCDFYTIAFMMGKMSGKDISDTFIAKYLDDEDFYYSYKDGLARVLWELYCVSYIGRRITKGNCHELVKKALKISQKREIPYNNIEARFQKAAEFLQCIIIYNLSLISMLAIEYGSSDIGKAIICQIPRKPYFQYMNSFPGEDLNWITMFASLVIDEKISRDTINRITDLKKLDIRIDYDPKFAFDELNKNIKCFEATSSRLTCKKDTVVGYGQLGYMYQNGIYVEKDETRARELYEKALQIGDTFQVPEEMYKEKTFYIKDNVLFAELEGESNPTIPNDIEKIAAFAFINSDLKTISIPGSVKSIGVGAFAHCENLEIVRIGSGVEELCDHCFDNDSDRIINVLIPRSVKKFGENVFSKNVVIQCPETAPVIKYAMGKNLIVTKNKVCLPHGGALGRYEDTIRMTSFDEYRRVFCKENVQVEKADGK